MGLIHIPRTVFAVARGAFLSNKTGDLRVGLSLSNPHVYTSRLGLFDIDYVGHMNNASYFNHCELAKIEMTAASGLLFPMLRNRCAYIVSSSMIRYRREISPLFRKFQVHTHVPAIDSRHVWMYHTFRYDGDSKILAQVLIKAVLWVDRVVVDPRVFLREQCEVDPELIREMDRTGETVSMQQEMDRFDALEESLRDTAARDDMIVANERKK